MTISQKKNCKCDESDEKILIEQYLEENRQDLVDIIYDQ